MSGGHWDYVGARIDAALAEIADDPAVSKRWPQVATLFSRLGPALRTLEQEMDWVLSGDRHFEDDAAWDDRACRLIRGCLPMARPCADEGGEA